MSSAGGLIAGMVGLSLFQVVVTNTQVNGHVGDVINLVSDALTYWLNPNIPLIPDRTSSGTSTSGSSYVQPAPSSGTLKHVVGDTGVST